MRTAPGLTLSHRAALARVAHILGAARSPWWVIAGAAVALHGVPGTMVDDTDVLIDADDFGLVTAVPEVWSLDPGHSDHFRSARYAVAVLADIHVEFMAGLTVRQRGDWVPVVPRSREAVRLAGGTVFIPDRIDLAEMLTLFDRPKDVRRAAQLRGMAGG
ncbi:hypothetical protein ASG37_12220 [Sphingomonas sp. Leaf407]|uniref:hypothetical protein n=1 Tax=unclassified Sphingomonas TaxID=196159 RepID=UPI0006FFDFE7|nr:MULTISPECIES: hypothetical protein [unclassified Sphingomonas]KQN37768.1 hypothetical protein ASE97_09510 [Sphingomonas sp. Leaf42]KQT28135.1 hypothetical protein ASG37_12220 [Sphingomonas sp. Leaf407]